MADRPSFKVPPEVPRYFADKGLKPGFSYLDVWGQEHAYSFTVAKAVDAELLGLFKSSIQRAIDKGEGFETWRKQIVPDLHKAGWGVPRTVLDPLGIEKPATVDFTSTRRLETIVWSNMRAARAAGQWERAHRTKKALPFFVYMRTASRHPREKHLAYVGIIRPVDDHVWNEIFPPNGYNCKCSVRQVTGREAASLAKLDGYSSEPPKIEHEAFTNRRTGEVTRVPVGVHPAWVGNPGRARAKTLPVSLAQHLDQAGPTAARLRLQEWFDSGAHRTLSAMDEYAPMPVAVAERLQAELGAKSPIVIAYNNTMKLKVKAHKGITLDSFALVQQMLDEAPMVNDARDDTISFYQTINDVTYWLAVRLMEEGYLRVATLFDMPASKAERSAGRRGLRKRETEGGA